MTRTGAAFRRACARRPVVEAAASMDGAARRPQPLGKRAAFSTAPTAPAATARLTMILGERRPMTDPVPAQCGHPSDLDPHLAHEARVSAIVGIGVHDRRNPQPVATASPRIDPTAHPPPPSRTVGRRHRRPPHLFHPLRHPPSDQHELPEMPPAARLRRPLCRQLNLLPTSTTNHQSPKSDQTPGQRRPGRPRCGRSPAAGPALGGPSHSRRSEDIWPRKGEFGRASCHLRAPLWSPGPRR
jgi:hypothetical protein